MTQQKHPGGWQANIRGMNGDNGMIFDNDDPDHLDAQYIYTRSRCYCGASGHKNEQRSAFVPVAEHHTVCWNICPRCWKLIIRDKKSHDKQLRKAERAAVEYVLRVVGAGGGTL